MQKIQFENATGNPVGGNQAVSTHQQSKRISFAQYLETTYQSPEHIAQAMNQHAVSMATIYGVQLPDSPIFDGVGHYTANPETGKNDKRQGYWAEYKDKSGVILPVYTFHSFRSGGKAQHWTPREILWSDYQAYKDGAQQRQTTFNAGKHKLKAAKLERESARKRAEAELLDSAGRVFVAHSARQAWEAAKPNTEHDYLARKGIVATGARVATNGLTGTLYSQFERKNFTGELCKAGDLLVPLYDADGSLVNIQRIDADGKKRFLSGGETKGCFYQLGGIEPALVVEGFADGVSVNQATGRAVYVAFSAYNLKHVCESQLSIGGVAADDGQAGIKAAKETGLPYLTPPNENGVNGYDWNDYALQHGLDAVREQLDSLALLDRSQPEPSLLNGWDLADDATAPNFLVDGFLEEDAHGILGGASMTYKSFFALRLAHSICSGEPFMGRKIFNTGPVVYVCGEGQGAIRRRLKALKLLLGGNPKHPIFIEGEGISLDNPISMAALIKKVRDIKPVLVIFDTFASLAGGVDENSNSEVGQSLNLVRDTCREVGASSLVVHHFGKDAEKGFRGASAFVNNVDFAFTAKKEGKLTASVSCFKMKDGEPFSDIYFKGHIVPLGVHSQNGEESTSLVAVYQEGFAAIEEAPQKHRAFAALEKVWNKQRDTLANSGRLNENPVVLFSDWKNEADAVGVTNLSRLAGELAEEDAIQKIDTGSRGGGYRPIYRPDA